MAEFVAGVWLGSGITLVSLMVFVALFLERGD